jgi:DNA invertase Pin-like site-specific DNA recombinase
MQNLFKYILYARKSSESEDKQMASIDDQIKVLNDLAEKEGIEIIEIINESRSAKAPGRVGFNRMLEKISKGEADGILCWKLDRLARNPVDGGNINWMLQQGVIKHIRAYDRNYYPTDNVMMMNLEFGMANQFIRELSQNTKRGLVSKAERGWFPGFTTLGYTNNLLKKKGEKEIISDTEKLPLVRKMFDLFMTGAYSVEEILVISCDQFGLKNKNNKPVGRSTFYRMLTDPFYYGMFEYPANTGKWYQGKHEPLISLFEYEKIQELLGRKGKAKPEKHRFPFTGLIRCGECGAMITAENKLKKQKNGNTHRYTYYHCTKRINRNCSQGSITAEIIEEQIVEVMKTIEIPLEFRDWALNKLKIENHKVFDSLYNATAGLRARQDNCDTKLNNLIDMRANGEIGEEEFSKKRNEITKDKNILNQQLNETNTRTDDWLKKAEINFTLAENLAERFKTFDLKKKKETLMILGSNLILNDKKLSISLDNLFLSLKKVQPEIIAISKRLEPLETPINTRTLANLYDQSPMMLRGWDIVGTFFV